EGGGDPAGGARASPRAAARPRSAGSRSAGACAPAPASAPPAGPLPPWPSSVAAAASSAAGPARGRRGAPRRRSAPGGGARPAAARRRSPLFLGDLLEHPLVQGQLGDEALQPGVLGLQLLKPLGLVGLEAAVLVPPPVQGLLAHAEALADLGEAQALGQVGLGLAQLGDDLFRRVSLHDSSPGPAGPQRLSYHLDQFLGSRPRRPRGICPPTPGASSTMISTPTRR